MNEIEFKKLIFNLLKNAFDYNKENSWVSFSLVNRENKIILKIFDGGDGISEKEKEKIFDYFYKIDSARVKNSSGIGLSIVKEILEKNNWKLDLKSELGKGSEFKIYLN